tara:strand:- start:80 stop:424 length:345 start_codon:yes stop_codon:yes gene_type:complete
MKSTLNRIVEIIKEYKQTDVFDGNSLNKQLKELTAYLYYIETKRTQAHQKYEKVIYDRVKEGFSVARAANQANVEVPEMYELRRLLESGYRVVDAMRTNISFLKSEMYNTPKDY